MSDGMTQEILYRIESEGQDKLLNELAKLRKAQNELMNEKKGLQKQMKDDDPKAAAAATKAFEANRIALENNRKELRTVSNEMKANMVASKATGDSLEDMKVRASALEKELKKMSKAERTSTEEGRRKVQQLGELNNEINESQKEF